LDAIYPYLLRLRVVPVLFTLPVQVLQAVRVLQVARYAVFILFAMVLIAHILIHGYWQEIGITQIIAFYMRNMILYRQYHNSKLGYIKIFPEVRLAWLLKDKAVQDL